MTLMSPKHLEDIKRGSVREYVSALFRLLEFGSVFRINVNQKAKFRIIVLCNVHYNGQQVCCVSGH